MRRMENAFGPTPNSFSMDVEQQIRALQGKATQEGVRRKGTSPRAILIALTVFLLIAGTVAALLYDLSPQHFYAATPQPTRTATAGVHAGAVSLLQRVLPNPHAMAEGDTQTMASKTEIPLQKNAPLSTVSP